MSNEIIRIMIEQMSDGWHVVAYIDDVAVETSPAIADRAEARREAKVVAKQLEAKFARKALARRALAKA